MFKIHEIRELIRLIDESTIDEFSYEKDGSKISIAKKGYVQSTVAVEAPVVAVTPVMDQPKAVVEAPAQEVKEEAQPVKEEKAKNETYITSPMVGTFYASPSPDQGAYVAPGDKVTSKSIVCIVEAMKLFNEIEADVNGEIVEVLVKNGQIVEYGQPLFVVKAE